MAEMAEGAGAEARKRLLFVVGSLRRDSFNRVLATHAVEMVADRVDIEFLEYSDVPLMNQDIEFPAPKSVVRVREKVTAADGVWFFSPEYNFNMTAPLKNLLDWLSRPVVAGDKTSPKPLTGKPVAIAGAGGRNATGGGRKALFGLLAYLGAKPVDGDGQGFVLPPAAWSEGMYDVPEEDLARLGEQAEKLLAAL